MALKTFEGALIYLAPSLELRAQMEVDFTVAHEFAHVYLQDYGAIESDGNDYFSDRAEKEADKMVATWGYEVPKYRRGSKS